MHARVGERALGHRQARLDGTGSEVHLDARVPAQGVDERESRLRIGVAPAEGVTDAPAGAARHHQVAHGPGHGVGADGREVLVRERVADERVVAAVAPPGEGAEHGGDEPGLHVERAIEPGPHAGI